MKYVSVDIETTGLNPDKNQVLQVAFVVEDSQVECSIEDLPYLVINIKHDELVGSLGALSMNSELIKSLSNNSIEEKSDNHQINRVFHIYNISGINRLVFEFIRTYGDYHMVNTPVTVAGKNVGVFDIPFLTKSGFEITKYFNRRTIDPSVFFLKQDDIEVPNLTECLKRAGIEKEVSHTALEDARDIIRVIRESGMFKSR